MYRGTATFWVSCFFRASTFKGPYLNSLARATFSKDVVFQNCKFSRVNLVKFLDLKLSGKFTERYTNQKIFPLNTITKTFASKLLSQGSIEQDNLSKNAKNFRFGGI